MQKGKELTSDGASDADTTRHLLLLLLPSSGQSATDACHCQRSPEKPPRLCHKLHERALELRHHREGAKTERRKEANGAEGTSGSGPQHAVFLAFRQPRKMATKARDAMLCESPRYIGAKLTTT